jgi:hypothetical protein
MAEAIEFASAGAGIASFAVGVFGSISALKGTCQYKRRKAPQAVEELTSHLEFVKISLDHAIRSCRSIYDDVEENFTIASREDANGCSFQEIRLEFSQASSTWASSQTD